MILLILLKKRHPQANIRRPQDNIRSIGLDLKWSPKIWEGKGGCILDKFHYFLEALLTLVRLVVFSAFLQKFSQGVGDGCQLKHTRDESVVWISRRLTVV